MVSHAPGDSAHVCVSLTHTPVRVYSPAQLRTRHAATTSHSDHVANNKHLALNGDLAFGGTNATRAAVGHVVTVMRAAVAAPDPHW